jgi:hypothetical protein
MITLLKRLNRKLLTLLLIPLLITSTSGYAEIIKINDDWYKLTSENVRQIYELKLEKEYWQDEAHAARFKNNFTPYYVLGGFIVGVLVAK